MLSIHLQAEKAPRNYEFLVVILSQCKSLILLVILDLS